MTSDAAGHAMTTPAPPPEAVLLRLARKAAGVTVQEAAGAAGISKAWLSSIENGFDTRGSGIRPVRAKDSVIARLAAFLRISPQRMETEGERPDAAAVLREMLRGSEVTAPPRDAEGPRFSDPALQHVWETPGLSPEIRRALVSVAQVMRSQEEPAAHAD